MNEHILADMVTEKLKREIGLVAKPLPEEIKTLETVLPSGRVRFESAIRWGSLGGNAYRSLRAANGATFLRLFHQYVRSQANSQELSIAGCYLVRRVFKEVVGEKVV